MSLILPITQLAKELTDLGFERVIPVMDDLMVCPTNKWVQDFGEWVKINKSKYEAQSWDCDEFALWARVKASESLCQNRKLRTYGHSFLVCTLLLDPDQTLNGISGGGWHACNIVRTPEGWVFFEPQSGDHELAGVALERSAVTSLDFVLL